MREGKAYKGRSGGWVDIERSSDESEVGWVEIECVELAECEC